VNCWFWQETLSLAFALYSKELPIIRSEVDTTWYGRHGVGLLLHAAGDVLTQKDLPVVITFLISRALVCDTIGIATEIFLLTLHSEVVLEAGKS